MTPVGSGARGMGRDALLACQALLRPWPAAQARAFHRATPARRPRSPTRRPEPDRARSGWDAAGATPRDCLVGSARRQGVFPALGMLESLFGQRPYSECKLSVMNPADGASGMLRAGGGSRSDSPCFFKSHDRESCPEDRNLGRGVPLIQLTRSSQQGASVSAQSPDCERQTGILRTAQRLRGMSQQAPGSARRLPGAASRRPRGPSRPIRDETSRPSHDPWRTPAREDLTADNLGDL